MSISFLLSPSLSLSLSLSLTFYLSEVSEWSCGLLKCPSGFVSLEEVCVCCCLSSQTSVSLEEVCVCVSERECVWLCVYMPARVFVFQLFPLYLMTSHSQQIRTNRIQELRTHQIACSINNPVPMLFSMSAIGRLQSAFSQAFLCHFLGSLDRQFTAAHSH